MAASLGPLSAKGAAFLGRLAVEQGLITVEQLRACEEELARLGPAAPGAPPRHLGTLLVARRLLADAALVQLLESQRTRVRQSTQNLRAADRRLGVLLVNAGHATREQVTEALRDQVVARAAGGRDVPRIGEILVQKGFCTPEQVSAALKEHHKIVVVCELCGTRYNLTFYNEEKVPPCKKCGERLVRPEALTDVRVDDSVEDPPPAADPEVPADVAAAMARPNSGFGKYVLLSELGRGGAGVVHKAWEPSLRRTVAIKILGGRGAGATETEIRRFYLEAQTAARLKHPGIVAIYEVGRHEDQHFLALEYVDGRTLEQVAEAEGKRRPPGGRIAPDRAAAIVRDAAQAVAAAHAQGIIHRDIKPQNILMDAQGKPHVADFGLAKTVDRTRQEAANLTLGGIVVGTPAYMSPEQASGGKLPVDRRTDVYSLGGVLYFLLAGRAPFRGANSYEIVSKVLREDPAPLRPARPEVPEDLERICLKCLDKDPDLRYPAAEALAAELERFLAGEPIEARPTPAVSQWIRRARRRPKTLVAAGAAALAAVALALLWPGKPDRSREILSLLAAAESHAVANRHAEARDAFTQVLALDPENAEAREGQRRCAARMKERERRVAEAAQAEGLERVAELERKLKALEEEKQDAAASTEAGRLERAREIAQLQGQIQMERAQAPPTGPAPAGVSAPAKAAADKPAKAVAAPGAKGPAPGPEAATPPAGQPQGIAAAPAPSPAQGAAPVGAPSAAELRALIESHRYAALRERVKQAPPEDAALAAQIAAAGELWDLLAASGDILKGRKVRVAFRSAALGAQDVRVVGLTPDTITVSGLFKSEGAVPQPLKDVMPESFVELGRLCVPENDPAGRERYGRFLLLHGLTDAALVEFAEAKRLGAAVDESLGQVIAACRNSIPPDADAKDLRRRMGVFQGIKGRFGRALTAGQMGEIDAIAATLKERLGRQEAEELLKQAAQAAAKKQYREAQSSLDKILRQYADTPAAPRAREMLKTLPTAEGRLLLGFDEAAEASPSGKQGETEAAWVSDPKQFREGSGAVHITLRGLEGFLAPTGGGFTGGGYVFGSASRAMVQFAISEQSFERMKSVSFWLYSDANVGKTGATKFCLFSPSASNSLKYFDASFVLEGTGWKLVKLHAGQFKKEGVPSIQKINAVGFMATSKEIRDFVVDGIRVKEE